MAQFVRDKESYTNSDQPDKQKMSVRFYHNAFEDPGMLWSKTVTLSKALPKPLVKYPDIVKYIKRGQLWVLNLEYVKDQVEAIGFYDKLGFSSPGKNGCVEILRGILSTSRVQVFVHANNDGYSQALDWLKAKLRYEKECPPFHEYLSKNKNYV